MRKITKIGEQQEIIRKLVVEPEKIDKDTFLKLMEEFQRQPLKWEPFDEMEQIGKITLNKNRMRETLNDLRDLCYQESFNAGWHTDLNTGELLDRNKGEMISLIHSEVTEMLEGERKDLMDDKLTHRKMVEVEAADAIIRILDYCGRWGYDVGGAFEEKIEFNRNRADFKKENRQKKGGKKF